MKATGMIRRIDELGRVVIPKEIRKTLRIKVGDELEIYTEEGGLLVMRKHSRMMGFGAVGKGVIEAIYRGFGGTCLLVDTTHVLFGVGAYRRDYDGKEITNDIVDIIERRRGSILRGDNIVEIVEDDPENFMECYVSPIIYAGDIYGALIMLIDEGDINEVVRVVDTASSFLALNLDNE